MMDGVRADAGGARGSVLHDTLRTAVTTTLAIPAAVALALIWAVTSDVPPAGAGRPPAPAGTRPLHSAKRHPHPTTACP